MANVPDCCKILLKKGSRSLVILIVSLGRSGTLASHWPTFSPMMGRYDCHSEGIEWFLSKYKTGYPNQNNNRELKKTYTCSQHAFLQNTNTCRSQSKNLSWQYFGYLPFNLPHVNLRHLEYPKLQIDTTYAYSRIVSKLMRSGQLWLAM